MRGSGAARTAGFGGDGDDVKLGCDFRAVGEAGACGPLVGGNYRVAFINGELAAVRRWYQHVGVPDPDRRGLVFFLQVHGAEISTVVNSVTGGKSNLTGRPCQPPKRKKVHMRNRKKQDTENIKTYKVVKAMFNPRKPGGISVIWLLYRCLKEHRFK